MCHQRETNGNLFVPMESPLEFDMGAEINDPFGIWAKCVEEKDVCQ